MTTLSASINALDIRDIDLPTLSNSTSSSSLSSISTECLDDEHTNNINNNGNFYIKDNSSLVTLMGQLNSSSTSTLNLMNKQDVSSASTPRILSSTSFPLLNSISPDPLKFSQPSSQESSQILSPYSLPQFSSPSLPSSAESQQAFEAFTSSPSTPRLQTPSIESDSSVPTTSERPSMPKKLKSSLRLPSLKRSNSLPQGIDGSNNAKQVRFSSNLTRVKTFTLLSKPMTISSDEPESLYLDKDTSKPMFECYSSDNEDESSSDDESFLRMKPRTPIRKQLSPFKSNISNKPYLKLQNFKTPNMLRGPDKIKLIELKIDSINQYELLGVVHVLNLSFEKKVEIKYSVDNWSSNFINFANYHKSITDKVDEFQFKINFKNLIKSKDYNNNQLLQICLIYRVNNDTYYDNNSNQNYQLRITKPNASPSSSSFNLASQNSSSSTIKSNFTGDFNHKYYFPSNFSSSSSSSSSSPTSVSSSSSNSSLSTMDMNFDYASSSINSFLTPSPSRQSSGITSPQRFNTAAYNEFLSKYCYRTS